MQRYFDNQSLQYSMAKKLVLPIMIFRSYKRMVSYLFSKININWLKLKTFSEFYPKNECTKDTS